MDINHLLAIAAVVVFIILLFYSNNPKRFYILYVLCLLPIMDLAITTVEWGRLRVFDFVSYIFFVAFFSDFVKIRRVFLIYNILFCLFILVLVFGSLNSPYIKNSLIALSAVFPVFIYAKALLTECFADREFQKKVVQTLKIVCLFSVLFLVIQMIVGLRFTFYPVLNRNTSIEEGVIRYPSFFHDPQMYGQYLVMTSFLFFINYKDETTLVNINAIGQKLTAAFRNNKPIGYPDIKNYFFFLVIIVALLQTGGRSALVAIFAGMIFLFFVFGTHYKMIIASILIVGAAVFLFFSSSLMILNRAGHLDEDYAFREALWNEARGIYLKHPLLGIGSGNFKPYNANYSNNYTINEDNEVLFFGYGQPESGYWMILTETGALGFIITFLFILRPVYTGIKSYLSGHASIIVFILTAGLISWLITFIAAYSLFDKRILLTLITFICILILESNNKLTYEAEIQ
ncbi:O-antigen ligase [Mucilaginibacter sp. UYP25]|uniref:O-antigen ligase family protein n=2 Tax=unclassified Mucilaginibacter TaxID=2617802 RepID=UPI003397D245